MPAKKTKFHQQNPNLPSGAIDIQWTKEMIEELDKCKHDIFHFAENYFYIVNLDQGKMKIELYPAQRRVLKALVKHKRIALLASRQIGKSTLMTIYALWMICFHEDKRVLMLANKEKTAIALFDRIRMAYEMLPNWLKPGIDGDYSKMAIKVANGSSIGVSATSSTAVRGDSANVLILDELAFVANNVVDEFWESVMPVISSSEKSQIFIVSTPNGTQNKFYEIYTKAERGESNWHAERVDWQEVPKRNQKWKRKMIEDLGSIERFNQEFGNQFIEVGQSPFRKERFDEMRENLRQPTQAFCDTPNGFEPQPKADPSTTFKIWASPNPKHVYVIGVDVGEGVGRAASTAYVLDITDLRQIEVVACYHSRRVQPVLFAAKLQRIGMLYGKPYMMIERNNCGGQVIDALYGVHHYERIVDHSPTNDKMKYYNRLGIFCHTNSKYAGVTNMRYWFDEINAVRVYDIATVQEFEIFVRNANGTWSHQAGEHNFDDRVMAIVWGLFILERDVASRYLEVIDFDETGRPAKVTDPGSEFNHGLDYLMESAMRTGFGASLHGPAPMITSVMSPLGTINDEMFDLMDQGWAMA